MAKKKKKKCNSSLGVLKRALRSVIFSATKRDTSFFATKMYRAIHLTRDISL